MCSFPGNTLADQISGGNGNFYLFIYEVYCLLMLVGAVLHFFISAAVNHQYNSDWKYLETIALGPF